MIRQLREQRGWSQSVLAEKTGVARASISAIETGRMTPSVQAALRIASVLGTSVERIFGQTESHNTFDRWTGATDGKEERYWCARVGELKVAYPIEPLPTGALAPDGHLRAGPTDLSYSDPLIAENTVVIATCDPLSGLLRESLSRRGIRLLPLLRTSREALRLLERGLVHAAGIHFGSDRRSDLNFEAASRLKSDESYTLLRYADWTAGVAVNDSLQGIDLPEVIRQPACRWINRPLGSSARDSFDSLLQDAGIDFEPTGYNREARSHHAVATIVSTGTADAGWTLENSALQQRLNFHPVHTDIYDLCFPSHMLKDHRIQSLIEAVQNPRFRRTLDSYPGISAKHSGELIHASH